jgi:hypothetical protein
MELVGGIYAEEPKNVEDMLQSWFSTKSPLAIGFREEDRGKWFYFCVRWETTAGLKGPWSPIMKVMIP